MFTITARNVTEALPQGLKLLREVGQEEDSRAGRVLVAPCPVMTIYSHPTERVLFSAERDANPIFHLAEALWMLAGRNDTAFLNQYVRDFGQRFAEPDGTIHGAYGYRWRHRFNKDQLQEVVRVLRAEPQSRQAVISMWDPNYDLGFTDLKDRPCNTHIYLRIQQGRLDLTVCCRSNDILWGAFGANVVHFSVLQEYLAAQLGIAVGVFYQLSNNFHAYVNELTKKPGKMEDLRPELKPLPLVTDSLSFDLELTELLYGSRPQTNKFLADTAYPMFKAYEAWRAKQDPLIWLARIEADDWRTAASEWISRRQSHARTA